MRASSVVLLLTMVGHPAQASEVGQDGHNFGLGLGLGYPTGITGKAYLGGGQAIDGTIAWWSYSGGGGSAFYLHSDYLWHPSQLTDQSAFELWWHVGVGGLFWSNYRGWYGQPWWDNDFGVNDAAAVRVPIGVDMDFHEVRLEAFAEAAGHVYIVPGVGFDIGLSVGARYFF